MIVSANFTVFFRVDRRHTQRSSWGRAFCPFLHGKTGPRVGRPRCQERRMLCHSVSAKFFLWVALVQIQLGELGSNSASVQRPNRLPSARSFRYRPLQPPADSLVPPPSVASDAEGSLLENSSGTPSGLLPEPCPACSLTMIDTVLSPEASVAQTVTTTADGDSEVRRRSFPVNVRA